MALFAASALLLGTTACDKIPFFGKKAEVKRASTRKAKKKKKAPEKIEAVTKALTEEPVYIYRPMGKTDPFMPFLRTYAKPKEKRKKDALPPTPLQKFDVSDFKLVAVAWGSFGRKALIQDNAGKGYIVTKGTLIGRSNGHIKDILEDKLVVEEEREDALGNTLRVSVELRLPETPQDIQAAIPGYSPATAEGAAEAEGEGAEEPAASESPDVEIQAPQEESP